jgi:exodeoxyribonuclease VII small subunit
MAIQGTKLPARSRQGQYWRQSPVCPDRSRPIATAKPIEVASLSFEAALRELETIVSRLEQGEVDLEDSISLYERGQALKAHCEAKLKAAEGRLEKIVLGASGAEGSVPADAA